MITCHVCGSKKITHYKQQRKDGVWVVCARCENDHAPEKGKPFYSIALFDLSTLPVLGETRERQQMEFSRFREEALPMDLIEWFESKKQLQNKFPPLRIRNA